MKQLFKIAIAKPAYVALLCFCLFFSILFALSSQLEIVALALMTKQGEVVAQKADFISTALRTLNQYFSVETSLFALITLLISVALFKALTLFYYRFFTKLLSIHISRDLRQKYFEHLQILPLSFYTEHHIGALSSRAVNDAYVIADAMNSMLMNYVQTPFTFLSTLILCFAISWQLSLVVFFGFPVLVVPIVFLARAIKNVSRQIQKKQEAFASVLVEFLSGIHTVKLFAREDFLLRKYTEKNNQMAEFEKKSARYDLASRPLLHTLGILCLVTVLIFGMYVLQLPLYEVLLFCGLLAVLYEPVKKFAEENGRILRGAAALERMNEVLSICPEIQDQVGATHIPGIHQGIAFENVRFGYGTEDVLQGVSFRANKGERVAIVGPTGSGKSTIVHLLARLYEPKEGQILIDGTPITAITQRSLRENIAFVPQKPFLFFDTVAENIAFGKPYAREKILKAAQLAHAEEFILTLEAGYDTVLSEAGKTLSGGQQQRLAIARALVKEAPVLVMDEATSSLDAVSEERIKEALDALRGHVIQIIIAHRLSTIKDADRIIYLERGRKIAEGTKDELLGSCPGFKKMWDLLHAGE